MFGRFGRVVDPLIAKLMRRGFKGDLAKLKKILEASTQDRPVAAGHGPETAGLHQAR
jgi:hypothetical protein